MTRELTRAEAERAGGAAFATHVAELDPAAALAALDAQIAAAIEAAPGVMLELGATAAEAEAHRERVAAECARFRAAWLPLLPRQLQ